MPRARLNLHSIRSAMAWVAGYCYVGSQRKEFPCRCGQDDRAVKEAWEGWGPAEWRCGLARGTTHQPNISVQLRRESNRITPACLEGNLLAEGGASLTCGKFETLLTSHHNSWLTGRLPKEVASSLGIRAWIIVLHFQVPGHELKVCGCYLGFVFSCSSTSTD